MSQKISQQDPVVTIADDDVFPLVQDSSGLNKKITGADLKAAFGSRYEKYVGLCSQASTGAPTVTILENSIGDIVWTRVDVGHYRGTLAGAFTENKTWCIISPSNIATATASVVEFRRTDANIITLITYNEFGAQTDDFLTDRQIEIRVYP